jgi:hypothetical protein
LRINEIVSHDLSGFSFRTNRTVQNGLLIQQHGQTYQDICKNPKLHAEYTDGLRSPYDQNNITHKINETDTILLNYIVVQVIYL